MAETDNPEEPTLLSKRKADDERQQETNHVKSQKLEAEPDQENQNHSNRNHDLEDRNHETPLPADGRETSKIDVEEDGDDSEEEGAPVDRKGKGILIEEEEDSDDEDDDSNDGGDELGAESDLSEDPLAEVDLDNILPSRTRRRVVQPGVYIANDVADNEDDSDDSDA